MLVQFKSFVLNSFSSIFFWYVFLHQVYSIPFCWHPHSLYDPCRGNWLFICGFSLGCCNYRDCAYLGFLHLPFLCLFFMFLLRPHLLRRFSFCAARRYVDSFRPRLVFSIRVDYHLWGCLLFLLLGCLPFDHYLTGVRFCC